MRTINDCRDWRDKCFTLISVNKPEDKVSTRYKCFCEGCEWKSHEPMSVSQEEESTPERGSRLGRRRGCKRTNERSDIKCIHFAFKM